MSNDALLQAAITAARASDLEEAAVLFARLVKEEPSSEQGWLGLGFCFSDKEKREYCFRRVLAINPNNIQARQALELLEKPVSAALPATKLQPSSAGAITTSAPATKPAPAVSPFLSEEEPAVEKSELVPKQFGKSTEKRLFKKKANQSVPIQNTSGWPSPWR